MSNSNLSPEELQRAAQEEEKKEMQEIEKETKREIFTERYKDKIFRYGKWGCIIFIFIIVFAVVVNILVPGLIIKPEPTPPTPTAQKPGGEFKINTESAKIIPNPTQEKLYDAIVQISNANPEWGAKKLSYKFILKDVLGNVVGEREGVSYILPQQSRYLIEIGIASERKAESVEIQIEPKEIQKFRDFENPQASMKATGQNYEFFDKKTRVFADIHNESPFGYETVNVNFLLYDAANSLIGVNYTNFNTFKAEEKRQTQAIWNYIIPAKIARIEVETNVNVFESGAFMGQYSTGQSLQY